MTASARSLVERPAGHQPGIVVDEREHERLLAVDVPMEEVHVPELAGPYRLVAALVVATLSLRSWPDLRIDCPKGE